MGVLPLFGLCCILDTQMLSGAAAPWRRQEMCVCSCVRARVVYVRACVHVYYIHCSLVGMRGKIVRIAASREQCR